MLPISSTLSSLKTNAKLTLQLMQRQKTLLKSLKSLLCGKKSSSRGKTRSSSSWMVTYQKMAMRRKRRKKRKSNCSKRRSSLVVKNSKSTTNKNFTYNNNSNEMSIKLQLTMKKKTKRLSTLIKLLWYVLRPVRQKKETLIIILKIKTSMRCSRSRKIWIPRSLI